MSRICTADLQGVGQTKEMSCSCSSPASAVAYRRRDCRLLAHFSYPGMYRMRICPKLGQNDVHILNTTRVAFPSARAPQVDDLA